MKSRILMYLCLIVFCISIVCPLCASATTPLDPDADASLTILYQKDESIFSDLDVAIYRVAEALPNGTFELIEPFASYPVNIHDITMQEQWKNVAVTLMSYIIADQVAPDREGITDASGAVTFENLETGLYLVQEVVAENNSGTYLFDRFMVYLPTPMEDGTFDYDVEARPKCIEYVPKTEYKVTKLWQDAGHQNERPEEITIDIFRDGVLQETQILDEGNNWSYTWYVSMDDYGQWTVVERSTPNAYTVTIQQNGGHFTIINTHESNTDHPNPPPTGDTVNLLPWMLVMCVSGVMLIILGVYNWRRNGA